ncbi:unnamed protein product [Ostreobium quekettii]|uniref:Uncharacterized protein n=1 Tax=Ostreobium quekettii TaxID=121088 RepID=A0A8S1J7V5_9CHLO|nr:unnamed protein product [Ostreobium quekettii]
MMVDTAPATQALAPCVPWTPPASTMPSKPSTPSISSTSSPTSSPVTPGTAIVHHRQTSSCCTTLSECSFYSAQEFWENPNLGDSWECPLGTEEQEQGQLRTRSKSVESFLPWENGPSKGRRPLEGLASGFPEPAVALTSKSEKCFAVVPPLELGQVTSRNTVGGAKGLPVVPPLQLEGLTSSNFKDTISIEFSQGPKGFQTCQNQLFVANSEVSSFAPDSPLSEPQASPKQLRRRSKTLSPPIQTLSNELFVEDEDSLPGSASSEVRDQPFRDAKPVKVSLAKRSVTQIAKIACMCAHPADGQGIGPWEGAHWGGKKAKGRLRAPHGNRSASRSGHRTPLATICEHGDECPEGEALAASFANDARHTVARKSSGVNNAGIGPRKDLKMKSLCPSIPGTDTKKFTADGPNASWVDEQFFDCSEAWEVMLAPFDSARGMDEWSQQHNTFTTSMRSKPKGDKGGAVPWVVPAGLQRPHQQKASVEDITPVYIPLSARGGTDDVDGDWVANLSARKVRLPGLADMPRQDELGLGLKSVEELATTCTGIWQRIPEESDDPSPLCDVMELPWIFKRALSMATQTEVAVDKHRVAVKPKLFRLAVPTAATPWSREGVMVPRRDRRKGMSRICLVRTTFGFRQYNCWADPYAGMSIVEIGVRDDGKLVMSTFIKRRTGPSCKIRTCMFKIQ